MDLMTSRHGPSLPLVFCLALAAGFAASVVIGTLPTGVMEGLVSASGLPSLLAAAEPPLGLTARALLAIAAGSVAAVATWSLASLRYGRRRLRIRATKRPRTASPACADAPAAPIMAHTELGAPFLSIHATDPEPDLPPVTAFEPIVERQSDPAPAEASVPAKHFVEIAPDTFILERRRHPRAVPAHAPERVERKETVNGLLARLERIAGAQGFDPARRPPPDLGDALRTLAALR